MAHGARSVLLTGDIEQASEAALSARGAALQSDVLKVAHHGSRTSSTPALLAAVAPTLAVVSAGRGNRFGHPHPEVLARLSAARVLRTDRVGGISLESDGRRWRLVSAASPTPRDVAPFPRALLPEAREHERDAGDHAQDQRTTSEAQ